VNTRVTEQVVENALRSQLVKQAPGSFGTIRLRWKWDKERIVRLTKAAIHTGRHAAVWQWASEVVIRKPGKDDYTQVNAYCSISLLSWMCQVVENVVPELLSVDAESSGLLSDGQFGIRKGRSAIDAAAIIVDRAYSSWNNAYITGVLPMDIKAAFLGVAKVGLVNLMYVGQMDRDLTRWTECFLLEWPVALIFEGNAMETHPVEAGVLQGSPVSPFSAQATPQDWSNGLMGTSQKPKGCSVLTTSAGWSPAAMSTTSPPDTRDAQQRAPSGRVDDGCSSTPQRRRRHCSRADMATRNTSGRNGQNREQSGMGLYDSTHRRHVSLASR